MRVAIVRALVAALALWVGAVAVAPAQTVDLTLAEAQVIGRQALMSGDAALAYAIATRLMEADPNNPRTLLLLSASATALGRPGEGRQAGRRAWAAAKGAPQLRYEVARFTARAAFAEGRPGVAQFWLRRAADVAPDAASAARTARDFADLRAARRLTVGLDFSVSPSSNLNGGASGSTLTVNDSGSLGSLSGSAQALEGVRAAATLRFRLKGPEGPRHRLTFGLRMYGNANQLTDTAQAQAPDVDASDLNLGEVEATMLAELLPGNLPRPLRAELGAGRTWYGGDPLGNHLRAEVSYPVMQTQAFGMRLGVSGERQWRSDGIVDATNLRVEAVRLLEEGGVLSLAIEAGKGTGDTYNTDHSRISAEFGLTPARPLGPAQLRISAMAGARDYPFYVLGPFGVPDGREDTFAGVAVEARLPGLSRYGYVPKVTLSANRTWSNISRYDSTGFGIAFGFASAF